MIVFQTQDAQIPANDRSAQYGDGCFTTACVTDGEVELLAAHIQRLHIACQRLHIDFTHWQELQTRMSQLAKQHPEGGIKAVISRGVGSRGYSPNGVTSARCYLSVFKSPADYPNWCRTGISVGLSSVQLAQQPLLAGIKHLNRLEQVLIKHQAQALPYDDVLVTDTNGDLIETGAANLFWRKGSCWFTPTLSQSGVSGVMRNYVLELLRRNGSRFEEVLAKPQVLVDSDEAFICNSLLKLCPIKRLTLNNQQHEFRAAEQTALGWFSNQQKDVKLHA